MSVIPFFPKLYKINNNTKISEWNIQIHEKSCGYEIVIKYGDQDGKQTVRSKVVDAGKAGRTRLQQSILETQSKWNDKKNKELYRESVEELVTESKSMKPMLANTYNLETAKCKTSRAYKMPFPCFTQRKYDGIRCLASCAFTDIRLESRKCIEFFNMEHIKRAVVKMFANIPYKIYLDGELYTSELDFETICGSVRLGTTENAEKTAIIQKIQYHLYDIYVPDQPDMPFSERYELLTCIYNQYENQLDKRGMELRSSPCLLNRAIQLVRTDISKSPEDIPKLHAQYVEEGFEGIMLRDPTGPYEPDKRSRYLQKFKEFLEEEFEIVGYHDGEGLEKGLVVWDCVTASIDGKRGNRFSVRPRGTHEVRRELFYKAEEFIGNKITVIFQEYTADGTPRFPVGKAIRDIY